MWQRFLSKIQTTIFGGALIVSGSWIVSKFLGLIKQRLTYTTFGPAGADSVYAAFALPDLIYGTLVLGSLLSAFMPVYMETKTRSETEAYGLSRAVMNVLAGVFFIAGILIIILAPSLVRLIVGDSVTAEQLAQTTLIMRLLSMNMLIFAVSNVLAGVLQSVKRFIAVSLAPIMYNLGIVLAIVLFGKQYGPVTVAYGAIAGALAHLIIHIIAARNVGWRFTPSIGWKNALVRRVGRLILPRTIGQSITQIAQFVTVPIATRLGVGQLAIFRMANDIQDAPTNIVGLSMATVAFPVFVEQLSQGRREEFIAHFSKIVRQILFSIIPLTVLVIQLRAQLVRVFYGAPNVSWEVTYDTAQTLGYFALSFVAQSLIPLLARSFYAMQDTKTPVRITTASVIVGIIGSIVLGPLMGVQGLALAYSISSVLSAGLLIAILHHRLGTLDDNVIIRSVSRIIAVTIIMTFAVQGTKEALVSLGVSLDYALGVLAQLVIAGLVGVLTYLIFASMFRVEEGEALGRAIRNWLSSIRGGNRS